MNRRRLLALIASAPWFAASLNADAAPVQNRFDFLDALPLAAEASPTTPSF